MTKHLLRSLLLASLTLGVLTGCASRQAGGFDCSLGSVSISLEGPQIHTHKYGPYTHGPVINSR